MAQLNAVSSKSQTDSRKKNIHPMPSQPPVQAEMTANAMADRISTALGSSLIQVLFFEKHSQSCMAKVRMDRNRKRIVVIGNPPYEVTGRRCFVFPSVQWKTTSQGQRETVQPKTSTRNRKGSGSLYGWHLPGCCFPAENFFIIPYCGVTV